MGFYRKKPKTTKQPYKKQIVTINIPNQYIDAMDEMKALGIITSRSELVREALKYFFEHEDQLREDLELKFSDIISKIVDKELAIV